MGKRNNIIHVRVQMFKNLMWSNTKKKKLEKEDMVKFGVMKIM